MMHRILVKDLGSSKFLNINEKKRGRSNSERKIYYFVQYLERHYLPFFISVSNCDFRKLVRYSLNQKNLNYDDMIQTWWKLHLKTESLCSTRGSEDEPFHSPGFPNRTSVPIGVDPRFFGQRSRDSLQATIHSVYIPTLSVHFVFFISCFCACLTLIMFCFASF